MSVTSLLVANRGEVAIRVIRAGAEMGLRTVTVFSEDDVRSLHTRKADDVRPLRGTGPAAYLDQEQLLAIATESRCDAVHPGYGFLSENAEFARRCTEGGVTFVGPRAETLELLGDKARARAFAEQVGVPILSGTNAPTSLEEVEAFLSSEGPVMLKAVAGGGGRGMRVVSTPDELEAAYARCRSEALKAFGNGDLYVERLVARARHVEVQVIGDGSEVSHLGERECSVQRRHQKLLEVAPCPWLSPDVRARILEAALRIAAVLRFENAGTFEFLVDEGEFAFIEANPRLQVEHTVTEEVTGVDLVKAQIGLAAGRSLAELGLEQHDLPAPRGFAVQVRVNMETMDADAMPLPASGTIAVFEVPSGPGVRVDSSAYAGYRTTTSFDSLLAKLIVRGGSLAEVMAKAYRALSEFRVEGVATNIQFLQSLLLHPEVMAGRVYTRFVEDHMAEISAGTPHRSLYFESTARSHVGIRVDPADPLAVLDHGRTAPVSTVGGLSDGAAVESPVHGTVVSIDVRDGDRVRGGQQLLVMESMKMEFVVAAAASGIIRGLSVSEGDVVPAGFTLAFIEETEEEASEAVRDEAVDLDELRSDLLEVHGRHAIGLDAARPDAVERRRAKAQRTARENIEDLCDPGTFVEYGPLVIAAQRRRRPLEELIERTPADGLVAGIGSVNGRLFEASRARCVVMSYDYTVLAGTQGLQNHKKKDRMFEIAERLRLPLVFFTEGGGGRPGDTDGTGVSGLDVMAFHLFGRLSGLVPLVAVNSGRCFAGNAALLGMCDVVIATTNSSIGMGGPAMIEGGGLGVFHPDDVGPMHVQVPNGVVDIAVEDEALAVRLARQYLSYFQGTVDHWECADQRLLRVAIPENRLRVYDVRSVIETLADTGSVLELRRHFGLGMVTALMRVEGVPMGVVANNPTHLAGAIDSQGADKATRFMQLCDAFDLPILFLCDTPGIMVGPEAERTALVRHCSRMFVTGASLSVPFFTIVLRKGYGLGAQAMAGGSFKVPLFTVAWPTGEFGGMGLEGAVKLGYRNELAAIDDPHERKVLFDEMVARMYEHGKALNSASHFEIDDVIDPAESRSWISNALRSAPPPGPRAGKKRPCIDTW